MNDLQISFLGLGAMGARMAQRLVDAGAALTVWNRSAAAADAFAGRARIASSPADAVAGAGLVISMLTDDRACRAVWGAALDGLAVGAVVVEASTVSPDWIATLAGWIEARGAALLDAPVVGTLPHADGGQLTWLVGGSRDVLARVDGVLRVMGRTVHPVGPSGSGAAAKLMVNAWFAGQVALLDEVLRVAPEIDDAAALELLGSLPVTAPAMRIMGGLMVTGDDAPRFPIDLVVKDLRYAAARRPQPMIGAALARYAIASAQGRGGLNITAVGGPR